MRFPLILVLLFLPILTALAATPHAEEDTSTGPCLRMTVAANDIASSGGQARQHYRIYFQNLCDSVRVVYWCAEHPSRMLTVNSVCPQRAAPQAAIAAPLYAVIKQREFQWTFPQGTRIRFIDCDDSKYPTSDFRCSPPSARLR